MTVGRALVLIAGALLWACAAGYVVRDGQRLSYEEAARHDLNLARQHLDGGDLSAARTALERLLSEFERSRLAGEARLLLGDVLQRQGQPELAAGSWSRLVEESPGGPHSPEAALRAALVYQEMGRLQPGHRLLQRVSIRQAPLELQRRILLLRARLAAEAGDEPDAIVALSKVGRDGLDPVRLDEIDRRLDELVGVRLTDAELESLTAQLEGGPARDRVLLNLAQRVLGRGDPQAALEALAQLSAAPTSDMHERRKRLEARARRALLPSAETLGLALPLSGPYRPFGERALRSVVLALGLFDRPDARFSVLIGDTRGEISRASEVVTDLIEQGADAIIGPLRSPVALAAAPAAELGGVPLLTLARHGDVPAQGEFVFRIGLTSRDEVRELVAPFVRQAGLQRFAVLYPDDAYGREFKNEFWDAVEAEGGEIVGVEKYDSSAVDWQDPIRKLVGLYPAYLDAEQKELLRERERLMRRPLEHTERLAELELAELPPYVDFDALFIPDAAEKVGLILPQLRFFDVEDVVFLGPSSWNDQALVEIAGRRARGAVFTSDFCVQAPRPMVQSFVERHRTTYGLDPDSIAARAFDAARLVERFLEDGGPASRERLRLSLAEVRDFAGVSGLEQFDAEGNSIQRLCLLTVRRGAIRRLDPAAIQPPEELP